MRWGGEDGTKLGDLSTGPGHWFISPTYQEASAAKAWGIDWDTWQGLSSEGKGVMLEHYRAGKEMEAWELKEAERKRN